MEKKQQKKNRAGKRTALAMVVGGDDSHIRDYNPNDGTGFPTPRLVAGGVDNTTGQPWYITVWS
jgi:hypothetical protein